jgi:hypothetical protein
MARHVKPSSAINNLQPKARADLQSTAADITDRITMVTRALSSGLRRLAIRRPFSVTSHRPVSDIPDDINDLLEVSLSLGLVENDVLCAGILTLSTGILRKEVDLNIARNINEDGKGRVIEKDVQG